MSARATVTLYVRPYIQKFVLANLSDLERIHTRSSGPKLWQLLNEQLRMPVAGIVNDFVERRERPTNQLKVMVVSHHTPEVTKKLNDALSLKMEQLFRDDLCATVDLLRSTSNQPIKKAILFHLATNGITADEDIPYESARFIYWRYERRLLRPMVQRRPRKHHVPIPPYMK